MCTSGYSGWRRCAIVNRVWIGCVLSCLFSIWFIPFGTLNWNSSITFLFPFNMFLTVSSCLRSEWGLTITCPSCAKPGALALPGAVPCSGVATDCPRCVTAERLRCALLFQSNAGISICASSPAFLSRANTFTMTPATQNWHRLSLVAHTRAARSTTWALWLRLGVNTTQLNYFSL